MNYPKLLRGLASLVALSGLCLMSVFPVAASELILPDQFEYEGLAFEKPLEITSGVQFPPLTLTFRESDEIEVTVPQGQSPLPRRVLAEQIVSPSPKKLSATPASSLPTLAQAVATIEDDEPTPTPTKTPVKFPTSIPTAAPEVKSETTTANASLPSYATNGSLNADVLFSMANQARAENGLAPFEKHPDVCAIAESRKPEIENEIYGNSSIHAGFRARNLPFRASENMISRGSETEAFNWWMNSSIHRGGILGGSKYACVACQNKTCAMIFSSLEPK